MAADVTLSGATATASATRQRGIVDQIWLVGLNQGDLSIADKYLTPDFRNHGSHDDALTGPESFKLTINKQRAAFSDIRYEILDFLSDGDRACVRWVMHGKHTGTFIGVPPTGKQVEHHAILILRFEGDKIAERWGIVDNFSLMRTLRGEAPLGQPAPQQPLPDGPAQRPVGRWFGTVFYQGKRDDYTVLFKDDGTVRLDTADSTGVGAWSAVDDGTFTFVVREDFRLGPDGSVPAKVLPGAAYVHAEFTAKAVDGRLAGNGLARIHRTDGSVVHSTSAGTVATRIAAN